MEEEKKKKKNKGWYSEEFEAMLERIEEEDNAERRGGEMWMMRKTRLGAQQVKALEKHFEEENKLTPHTKARIAQDLGLHPRQVAVWFQNRRARFKSKQLEREYDQLRATYDALMLDYGSLEQQKTALLSQLKDLKAKIEAKTLESANTLSIPALLNSNDLSNEGPNCLEFPLSTSSTSSSYRTTMDPLSPMASSSSKLDGFQLWKAYQDQLVRMEELGISSNEDFNSFFSIDQAPTLHWHQGD